MIERERAETLLRERSGLFLCASCLAGELDIPDANRRELIWRLRAVAGYEMRQGQCIRCRRRTRVVRHVGSVWVAGLAADIVAVLLRHAASKLCDPCVAFATNSSLDRVTQVLEALTPFSEFRRFKTMCSICGGINKVTTAKVDGGTPVVSHSGLHRGWRLVVLSYRLTSCRWRPMVIMKPPRGSSLPDAGSLVRATFASKAEADRRAVRAAREWIDGHAHSGQGGQTPAGCSDVGVAEVDGRHVVATSR